MLGRTISNLQSLAFRLPHCFSLGSCLQVQSPLHRSTPNDNAGMSPRASSATAYERERARSSTLKAMLASERAHDWSSGTRPYPVEATVWTLHLPYHVSLSCAWLFRRSWRLVARFHPCLQELTCVRLKSDSLCVVRFWQIAQHGSADFISIIKDGLRGTVDTDTGLGNAAAAESPTGAAEATAADCRRLVAEPNAPPEEAVYFYDDDGQTISTMGSPREESPR